MTTRERWIVYPLLFLAVGSAFWTRLQQEEIQKFLLQRQIAETPQAVRFGTVVADEVRANRITGESLELTDRAGNKRIQMGSSPQSDSGFIKTFDGKGDETLFLTGDRVFGLLVRRGDGLHPVMLHPRRVQVVSENTSTIAQPSDTEATQTASPQATDHQESDGGSK